METNHFMARNDKLTGTQPSDTEVNGNQRMKIIGSYLYINIFDIYDGLIWSKSECDFVDVHDDKNPTVIDDCILKR